VPAPEPGAKGQTQAVDRIRDLITCLVGVAHAEVALDDRGEVQGVRIWGTGESSPDQTVRSVQSALRAHLDLPLSQDRIRFIGDPVPPNLAAPATETETVAAPTAKPPPDDLEDPDDHPADDLVEPATDPSALGAPASGGSARILYDGFEIIHHRSEETELRVKLDWGGWKFLGVARASNDPEEQAEALAKATLKGLEDLIHARRRDASVSIKLVGIQFHDAFKYRMVTVVVELAMGREVLALSGSAVVRHVEALAAILAVLQATDRRVRALLDHPSTHVDLI